MKAVATLRGFLVRHKKRFRFLKPLWLTSRVVTGQLPWRWLPMSSRLWGPPKGWHASTVEYIRSRASDPRDRERPVFPAEVIRRTLPKFAEAGAHWKYLANLSCDMPPMGIFELHDIRYWGDFSGTLIGRDDRILGDTTTDVWEVPRHKIFTKIKLPACRRLEGVTAILSASQAEGNYTHWTYDVLPRLDLLHRGGFPVEKIDWFVVNHRDLPFQRETLEELGVPWAKVIRADASLHLECAHAVTTSLKPDLLAITPSVIAFLQGRAVKNWPEAKPCRRLYVTRRNAAFRLLLNEAAVWDELAARGFEVVECEKLTVAEQRQLFREAAVVVAPHGSGLTNLIYCQPGTKVLEFMSPRYADLAFWCGTGDLGLDYWVLFGAGAHPPEGVDPQARQDDITMEIAPLHRTLAAMGIV